MKKLIINSIDVELDIAIKCLYKIASGENIEQFYTYVDPEKSDMCCWRFIAPDMLYDVIVYNKANKNSVTFYFYYDKRTQK